MEYTEIEPYKAGSRWFSRDGHFYVVNRTRGTTTSLRCASEKCPAHWIFKPGKVGPVIGEHDHEPQYWIANRNAMFQTLKRRSTTETIPLSIIYEEEATKYIDAAPYLTFESVSPSMRKWRTKKSKQPAAPNIQQDDENAVAVNTIIQREVIEEVDGISEDSSSHGADSPIDDEDSPTDKAVSPTHGNDSPTHSIDSPTNGVNSTTNIEDSSRHNKDFRAESSDEDSSDTEKQSSVDVWRYFERESAERARCVVCRATVTNLRELLIAHLKSKHPKVLAGASEEETDIFLKDEVDEDQEDMYTEVVYLEEEPKDDREEKRRRERRNVVECKPIRRKNSPIRSKRESPKRRAKRRESVSSDEHIPKKPKATTNEDDTEIESFGKYITCLLKKLPRNVCRQLQMNIVNLIMSANLNEESNKNIETVPITIQRLPIQTVAGTSYLLVNDKDDVVQNAVLASSPQINNVQNHVTITTSSDIPTSTA